MRRPLSLSEKELEVVLLIRQLVAQSGNRDTDILVQKRGGHLRVCSVGMPERLPQKAADVVSADVVQYGK